MKKVAYLLAPGQARYLGKATGIRYEFTPWADVDDRDWPELQAKFMIISGCCSKPARQMRVFGSEEEVQQGLVGFSR